MNRINFILSTQKVISVNAIYKARVTYVGGRQVATIYKSREAKMTEAYIKEQVDSLNIPVNYPWVTKNTLFKLTIRVVFKSGIGLRDLDNVLKLLIDGIFRALDINDSHVVSIVADKVLLPDAKDEKIFVCLEECSKEGIRFDYIPHPSKIWCEDIVFSLPDLPEKRVIKNKIYKTLDPERADTFVYIIRPDNLGYFKSASIMLRVLDCVVNSSGFIYIAIQNSPSWTSELVSFKNLISEQQKEYSGIKIKEFDSIDEDNLLSWINT